MPFFLALLSCLLSAPFLPGVQSAEEDSADQGSLESIPIRGKKAEQEPTLLGVLHHRPCALSPLLYQIMGGPFFLGGGGLRWLVVVGER